MTSPTTADNSQPTGREEKRQNTRRRVLEAALQVFESADYQEANTAEIARLAGVSHGTVFTVEPTKERLAAAAFDDRLREIGEAAFAQAFTIQKPLPFRIMSVFIALFDFYEAHDHIARILLRELLLSAQPTEANPNERLLRDYLTGLRVLLQTGGKSMGNRDLDALSTAILGIYIVFLLGQLNGIYPDRDSLRERCQGALVEVLGEDC
ncbi:MAG: TetR/AcrR family transcriptional regulator [Verrucomicrobiae bacterium]|nr:TetR/AcrR family transcriptional regulator [Verrucomicrobiae bacterium]